MAWIRTNWEERLGTGLNKYTKTNETSLIVELTNAPDSITQAGTPFSVIAMNNIESGIDELYNQDVTIIGNKTVEGFVKTSEAFITPSHVNLGLDNSISNGGGSISNCVSIGDEANISVDPTDFLTLNQTHKNWFGMTTTSNGDIYTCVNLGDIYKQTGGIGNFLPLGQTARDWYGMTTTSNGDIYATDYGRDIYKQTSVIADFLTLNQTHRSWTGMTTTSNGDVYAAELGGDIYKQTNGLYAIQIGRKFGTNTGVNSVAIGNDTDASTPNSVIIGSNTSTNVIGGNNQINITNRFKYFEFPSTTPQSEVFSVLEANIILNGMTSTLGHFGLFDISMIKRNSTNFILHRYNGSGLKSITNVATTIGSDLQVSLINYAAI